MTALVMKERHCAFIFTKYVTLSVSELHNALRTSNGAGKLSAAMKPSHARGHRSYGQSLITPRAITRSARKQVGAGRRLVWPATRKCASCENHTRMSRCSISSSGGSASLLGCPSDHASQQMLHRGERCHLFITCQCNLITHTGFRWLTMLFKIWEMVGSTLWEMLLTDGDFRPTFAQPRLTYCTST